MPTADAVDALLEALDAASRLLRGVGESFWAAKLEGGRQRMAAGDAHGLRMIAGLLGGMGSFNDLLIHPINGHEVESRDVDEVNGRLGVLRATIDRLARELIRELELG